MITDFIPRIEISADEERELIRIARERVEVVGHSVLSAAAMDARERLIEAYASAINRAAKVNGLDWDDLEQDLIETFLRAIDEYDFASNNRLSHEIKFRFMATVRRAQSKLEAFSVTSSWRALFYQIYFKEADGNWDRALEIVDSRPKITRETFTALANALLNVSSSRNWEGATDLWSRQPEVSSLEIVDFVAWLKDGLDDRERDVIDLHYGFDTQATNEVRLTHGYADAESLTIPQIANVLRVHRQTAWRIHGLAIEKMRSKIGE